MKAITISLGISIVALLAVIPFGSSANADCPGDCVGGGFCALNLPSNVVAETNGEFAIGADDFDSYPTKNGQLWAAWCTDSESDPWIGAAEIVTESTNMSCFNTIEASPAYFYPSDCEGSFDVAVRGDVITTDPNCDPANVAVKAFVWSPYESDTDSCEVFQ